MIYDASIYTKDYNVIMYGLTILKYIYKKGKQENMKSLMENVDKVYNDLEETLKRPERNDLGDSLELILHFKADRKEGTLSFPILTEHLHKVVYSKK